MLNLHTTQHTNTLQQAYKPQISASNLSLVFSAVKEDPLDRAVKTYCAPGITRTLVEVALRKALKADVKKFQHSVNVAKKAEELAERFGVDPDKALLAGFLHDFAKNMTNTELKDYAEKHDVEALPEEFDNLKDLHAPVGAKRVELELEVCDKDILKAIRTHVTGVMPSGAKLTPLQKVVIIADKIVDDKKNSYAKKSKRDRAEKLEKALKKGGLDKAMKKFYKIKLKQLNESLWLDI